MVSLVGIAEQMLPVLIRGCASAILASVEMRVVEKARCANKECVVHLNVELESVALTHFVELAAVSVGRIGHVVRTENAFALMSFVEMEE